MYRRLTPMLIVGILLSLLVAGCSGGKPAVEIKLAPVSDLPDGARSAAANVQEAYRFAIANKELLEQIPCFCGCVAGGHESNYNCYVAEDGGPGVVLQFDSHALG